MLLMALDHTRDFFSSAMVDPTDPLHSWPSLFATRWITHLCAPGFIAMAGTSAYLQVARGKTPANLNTFLATRGLWLIVLDLTVISFSWSFTLRAPYLQVIWAIGGSMIALAFLQWLPTSVVAVTGAAITLFHNLLDPIRSDKLDHAAAVWTLLYQPGFIQSQGKPIALVAYPLLPWIGVMCLGYAFGALVVASTAFRQKLSTALGIAFLAAFVLLRSANSYGDDHRWRLLPTTRQSIMDFLVVNKYPPSLEYVLVTFGLLLLLYALLDLCVRRTWTPKLRAFVKFYGRVPFFYYVLHIYLIHGVALLRTLFQHGDWRLWVNPRLIWYEEVPPGWGFSLPVVYLIWLSVVILLFYPCLWFGRIKAKHKLWWLSYL
jgi:uncharacterized membrane protein